MHRLKHIYSSFLTNKLSSDNISKFLPSSDFLAQWFEPPETLPIHTLSKLHYLIHELYLKNHLSFLELLNCGAHCHPLLSLNPTICHLANLTSTNLILSPFLKKLPFIFSVFPLSGLCYRPYGLFPTLLTKKKLPSPCKRVCPYSYWVAYFWISMWKVKLCFNAGAALWWGLGE